MVKQALNALLFASTVLIWGTTWIAIAAEIGPVPVLVSIFYRFALAAALFLAVLGFGGRLKVPAARHHPFIAAQGACLFCCNFIGLYTAAAFIPSGLVSVVFSLATLFNAVNARLFFGTAITGRVALAAVLGVAGVALLSGREAAVALDLRTLEGLGAAALGTLFFSLGNMVSRRNSAAGITPALANAWGMVYGAAMLLALIACTRTPLVPPPSRTYVLALFYLAAVGSVVGFTTYLSLVARVGPSRAAYATVLFPVVALVLSTLYENYSWDRAGVLGLLVALSGNVLAFSGAPGEGRLTAPRRPSGPRGRAPA